MRRDLFDSEQSHYLSDPALLRRLATEKLEGMAELARAEGWAWAEARVEFDGPALRQFARCEPGLREPTADEEAALADMKTREAELDAEGQAMADSDAWTPEDAERIDLEEQDIAAHRSAILDARRTWTDHDKAHAGVILTVNRQGDPEVLRGLVREADRKVIEAAARRASSAGRSPTAAAASSAECTAVVKAPACSEALMRRLTAHQTAALQAVLARSTPVALAALTHVMVMQVFDQRGRSVAGLSRSPLQVAIRVPKQELVRAADDLVASKAWNVLETVEAEWRARLPEHASEWLTWLCALPLNELLDLLAFCAASTLNVVRGNTGKAGESNGGAGALAAVAQLDMADWWESTAVGYLAHVSKSQIVKALQEGGPDLTGDGVADMKKDALVVAAASRLAGTRWLPEPLRACTGR